MATTSVKVILLDIEGTVCPISFVKDVLVKKIFLMYFVTFSNAGHRSSDHGLYAYYTELANPFLSPPVVFPYALQALPETLRTKWDSPEFAQYRNGFPPEFATSQAAFLEHVEDLMSSDVKASYLKSLQGYLWENGYKTGELKAPLFPDVAPKFESWTKKGLVIMIYSSGSVPAQKLLFRYTDGEPADLTPMITDYFDTVNAGPKITASSYKKIMAKYSKNYSPPEWLFLSDNVKEVEAAKNAGMQSLVVQRPGNAPLPPEVGGSREVVGDFAKVE